MPCVELFQKHAADLGSLFGLFNTNIYSTRQKKNVTGKQGKTLKHKTQQT
jgi:hypothetical protein